MGRVVRIAGGSTLVVAGAAMLVLPGPGILTIAAGLAVLAKDLEWARRATQRIKEMRPEKRE
ncbi:MAG: PGPGW domain-containing protein [Acidimicrobiia bacterium]